MAEEDPAGSIFVFACLGLVIGLLCKVISKAYAAPYTPMLIVIGIAWGLLDHFTGVVGNSALEVSEISPVRCILEIDPDDFHSSHHLRVKFRA